MRVWGRSSARRTSIVEPGVVALMACSLVPGCRNRFLSVQQSQRRDIPLSGGHEEELQLEEAERVGLGHRHLERSEAVVGEVDADAGTGGRHPDLVTVPLGG